MKKWMSRKNLLYICCCGILAAEVLFLVDAAAVFWGGMLSIPAAAFLLAALLAFFCFLFRGKKKCVLTVMAAIPMALVLVTACGYACWKTFSDPADYTAPDAGKYQIYGNRKVMIIVPHQDDELNVLGGVMEEYARYGSELYGVYVTNGDYMGLAETRYREAVAVFGSMGVPEDHVIFLGYGDGWQEDGPHIYNAESGQVVESHHGRTETYGTSQHAAYREGREYTIDNLMEDLEAAILECRPDVIFCSDYDHHIDHKATTLLFDKVMGTILKGNPDYTPVIYKAYAYGTAWEAEPDYYADNILSTQNLFAESYNQKPAVYRWEDRVRFPVDGSTLSRSLVGSDAFKRLSLHKSPGANAMAAAVINGDKVAWRRNTDSLCLHADITASSGQTELLNDFMLIENLDLVDTSRMPYDGVWIPGAGDDEKTVTVTFQEASDISTIVLYDHPSEEHNILNAVISFDDGTGIETGPLDPGGAATSIAVNQKGVASFAVSLTETEGEQAGLSEIEAFSEEPQADGRFVKLMDAEGNFVYDYWTGTDGNAEFSLYIHGDLPALAEANYFVNTDSEAGSAILEGGVIRVNCPVGESFVLNVTCDAAGVSDSVYVQNPGKLERMWTNLWRGVEQALYARYSSNAKAKLLIPNTLEKLSYVIEHLR